MQIRLINLCVVLLACALGLPLITSVWGAVAAVWQTDAWSELWADTQWQAALGMSLWTGVAASTLAIGASAAMLGTLFANPAWQRMQRWLAPLLAVPHAAFAIGVIALVAPSGWLLRLVSPWATGLTSPPPWPTTQDPWGLGLIAVLVLKEIPFLLWCASGWLQRPDVHRRLTHELQLARTMGYTAATAWWRVAWPQCVPHLLAPALAVWAYSLTVVDVALVIGPASPPPLAVLAWQWLRDPDASLNAQGLAAAWLLVGVLTLGAGLMLALAQPQIWRKWWSAGVPFVRGAQDALGAVGTPTKNLQPTNPLPALRRTTALHTALQRPSATGVLRGVYAAVLLALALGSVIGSWRFPALLPDSLTWNAWEAVASQWRTVGSTVCLALAASAIALVWSVAWLELASARMQSFGQWPLTLPLVLPAVVWVSGLHRSALFLGVDANYAPVLLAHCLACVPYVYLAVVGPYTGFSPRYWQLAATLGHTRWRFLYRVKWPLLRAALASGFAVGFAVSVAQYLPTLYLGAGRISTVTTEAIAQSAGGQRSLAAAFAWLQWLLPVSAFALAGFVGKARRFPVTTAPPSR
jgi:putative thiamine transport system permease protein